MVHCSCPDTKDVKRSKKNILLNSRTGNSSRSSSSNSQRVDRTLPWSLFPSPPSFVLRPPSTIRIQVQCPLSVVRHVHYAKMANGSSKEQRACNDISVPFSAIPHGPTIAGNKFAISNFSIFNLGTKAGGQGYAKRRPHIAEP